MDARKPRSSKALEGCLIALFLATLLLPAVRASLDGWRHVATDELREPAPWPSWRAPSDFAAGFEAFFDDRLGFRSALVTLHAFLKARLLGTAPNPQVLLGREGWLFFNGRRDLPEADRVVQQARGARLLSGLELEALMASLLERRASFEALSIPYLLVVAPNKHTIYPEYLPAGMNRVGQRTPLDQLAAALAGSGLALLDLRPALLAAKARGEPLYYRTDSHWNGFGAHVAYTAILRAAAERLPGLAPRPLEAFEVSRRAGLGSTLAGMIALRRFYRDDYPSFAPVDGTRARRRTDEEVFGSAWLEARPRLREWLRDEDLHFSVYEVPDPTLPHALFLVDSYGQWLIEWLAEHFQTTTFLHRRTPWGIVQRVVRELHPDLVVEEMGERSLVPDPAAPEVPGGG